MIFQSLRNRSLPFTLVKYDNDFTTHQNASPMKSADTPIFNRIAIRKQASVRTWHTRPKRCTPSVHQHIDFVCPILRSIPRPSESLECICRASMGESECYSLGASDPASKSSSPCRRVGGWPVANTLKLQAKTSAPAENVFTTATFARAQRKRKFGARHLSLSSPTTSRRWTQVRSQLHGHSSRQDPHVM